MSVLTYEELRRDLERRSFHPVYLLLGPDEYQRRCALLDIKSALLKEGIALDFNWEEFSGPVATPARILNSLRTLPVMSSRRAVLVTETERMEPAGYEALAAYLQNPNARCMLILTGEDLDRRTSIYKALREHAQVVEFPKLKGYALTVWVEDYVRQKGHHISSSAAQKLADLAGSDLQNLIGEIEKLLLYAGEEKTISPAALDQMVESTRQHNIFELTEALGRCDRPGALRSLASLLDSGEKPLAILGMMARHFRQVIITKEMLRAGYSTREIGQAAQIPGFVLDRFLRQARTMGPGTAERIFECIGRVDVRMKTSGSSERILLESLILELPG